MIARFVVIPTADRLLECLRLSLFDEADRAAAEACPDHARGDAAVAVARAA